MMSSRIPGPFSLIRVLAPLFSPGWRPGLGWCRLEYGELFTGKDIRMTAVTWIRGAGKGGGRIERTGLDV